MGELYLGVGVHYGARRSYCVVLFLAFPRWNDGTEEGYVLRPAAVLSLRQQ